MLITLNVNIVYHIEGGRIFGRLSLETPLLKVLPVHVMVFQTAKYICHNLDIQCIRNIYLFTR